MRINSQCLMIIFCFSLTGCSIFHTTPEEDRVARCKMLNSKIIFNGATANQTVATQQRAELETLSRNYHEDDCESR
jgi:hypothetical protein